MFLTVEIFVVEQSVNVYIYLCVAKFGLDVFECFFFFSFHACVLVSSF